MSTAQTRYSPEEIARRGDNIYERIVRPRVEATHHGKVVAIDIESETFAVGDNVLDARRNLNPRPDAEIWCVRVGHRSLHRIGGSTVVRK